MEKAPPAAASPSSGVGRTARPVDNPDYTIDKISPEDKTLALTQGRHAAAWEQYPQLNAFCKIDDVKAWTQCDEGALSVPVSFFDGPKYLRWVLWIVFGPITSMWEHCDFVLLCSCHHAKDVSRMSMAPFFTSDRETQEKWSYWKNSKCDECGYNVDVQMRVYCCSECKSCYCKNGALQIPSQPKKRLERICKEYQNDYEHWIHSAMDDKAALTPIGGRCTSRRTDITFKKIWQSYFREGCSAFDVGNGHYKPEAKRWEPGKLWAGR